MLNPALLVSGGHLREDKKKKKANAALSPVDSTVWEVLLLPLATHKTFAGFFHLQSLCACLSTPALSPAHNSSGYRAASRWLCGEPGKYRPSMANISPLCLHGNIWPSQAVRAPPSACLTVSLHTLCWCILVLSWLHSFYSYTGTGLLYKQSTISTIPKQTG